MRSADEASQALLRLFQRQRVAELKDLFATLKTHSRMTVLRRLSTVGYLSSYNCTGRYYTLANVPEFDEDGLWQHAGAGFSRAGTLKETVVCLVEKAEAGLFHRELQVRLQVRVHNTLADLVEAQRIGRERLLETRGEYLYVSADRARATVQVAHRRLKIEAASTNPQETAAELAPSLVIDVLVEVIHGSAVRLDARQVAARLAAQSIAVTEAQVQDIFQRYGVVKKKEPSRSPRSRR